MTVTRKVKLTRFRDGSTCWNAQIWTQVNEKDGFYYCGEGRFCKSREEAEAYKIKVLESALKRGEKVDWE